MKMTMRGWIFSLALVAGSALSTSVANGAILFEALSSFGGDGWLSPAEVPGGSLGIPANSQRGMAYSAMANQVYVVDRNGGLNVRIYNAIPVLPQVFLACRLADLAGGTFPGNAIGSPLVAMVRFTWAILAIGDQFQSLPLGQRSCRPHGRFRWCQWPCEDR